MRRRQSQFDDARRWETLVVHEESVEFNTLVELDTLTPIEDLGLPETRARVLSVTTFSDLLWCEKRSFFQSEGFAPPRTTPAMKKGTKRHNQLDKISIESNPVAKRVQRTYARTKEDYFGLRLLDCISRVRQLRDSGEAREILVFGKAPSNWNTPGSGFRVWIIGCIDEVKATVDSTGQLKYMISDTKTRNGNTVPGVAQKKTTRLQLFLYKHLFDCLATNVLFSRSELEQFLQDKSLKPHACLSPNIIELLRDTCSPGCDDTLLGLMGALVDEFSKLSISSDALEVVYEAQSTRLEIGRDCFCFDKTSFDVDMKHLFKYITGRREADCVTQDDKWKCKTCQFFTICTSSPLKQVGEAEQVLWSCS